MAFASEFDICVLANINKCEFDDVSIYSGFDSEGGGWRKELLAQIDKLRLEYDSLILFLDDFYIYDFPSLAEIEKTKTLVNRAIDEGLKYVALNPLDCGFVESIFKSRSGSFREIKNTHPYYRSLKVAFWDIEYLYSCLSEDLSIWNFERKRGQVVHFESTSKLLKYCHIVEKGLYRRWLIHYLGINTKTSSRGINREFLLTFLLKRIRIRIFGYLGVR